MRGKRFYCEDMSNTIRLIKSSKKHGKTIQIDGNVYEYIGDDLLFNTKTNRIEKQNI